MTLIGSTREHGVDGLPSSRSSARGSEQRHGLGGHPMFRVVEEEIAELEREGLEAAWFGREQLGDPEPCAR